MPGVRPACVANRWGQGTCSSDKPKTEVAKEMEAKLAALKAEREKQDLLLFTPLKTPK
jgi:hypothetical protein